MANFSMRNRFSVPNDRDIFAWHSSVGGPYEGLNPIADGSQIRTNGEGLIQAAGSTRGS